MWARPSAAARRRSRMTAQWNGSRGHSARLRFAPLGRCRKMPGVESSVKQTSWVKGICPVNGELLSVNRVESGQADVADVEQ